MGANGSWLLVVLLMGAVGAADDWSNCPSVCRCKWVSGKKVAECSNAALTTVPDGLSSEIQSIDLSGKYLIICMFTYIICNFLTLILF